MPLPIEPERDDTSIVLVGSFNPAIFQPMWFAVHQLISTEEAEGAVVGVVHDEITQFRTGKLRITVETNRFIVICSTTLRDVARDLVVSCFGELLFHTPVKMFGLNRDVHFSCGDEPARNRFGQRLAPPDAWGKWGADIRAHSGDKVHGGVFRIGMRSAPREGDFKGHVQVEVQRSTIVRNDAGVVVTVNDHYDVSEDERDSSAITAVNMIDARWGQTAELSDLILSDLMLSATGRA
jgi:hypothetical protein